MNIILMNKRFGCTGCFTLTSRRLAIVASVFLVVMPVALLYAGYHMGMTQVKDHPSEMTKALKAELDTERQQIREAKRNAEDNMNALALRLGQMQAHVIRLDALGQRLTKMAKLDNGEFDFDNPPGEGGPVTGPSHTMDPPDFMKALNQLSAELDDRTRQLTVLENLLMHRNLQAEVMPAGRPVKHGWLSSPYGMRTDPFTGKVSFHPGMDFAGKIGTPIMAVAAGVVDWAGRDGGYGNLVEINHGNGYQTRYGHNSKILVKVGETVKKGQVIALMGSTGRSTGPHCHFEVRYHGHPVNPKKYIQAAN